MTADDRAVGAPERLHPLFLVTGLGGSLRGIFGGYAAIGYLAVSGRWESALIGGAALLLFVTVGVLLYWRRFEYRVGADEIRIDSGILSRTHRSIPFERIQDVDIVQGPLARLLGLAKVKFETGSAGGSDDEGVLQAIALDRAQELRTLVRARRASAPDADDRPSAAAEVEPIFAMDLRRVLLAGMFNFSLALFAGLFGVTQTFGDVLGFDPFSRAFWLGLLSAGDPVADFVLANRLAAAIAGAAVLTMVGLVTGVIRTSLRDYGFRLDRAAGGLRRRRGLLTRTDVTLPIVRAQAAIVGTGPVRDAFGWRELRLQNLARDEGGSGDHVLAPLAHDAEVDTILSELSWRPVAATAEWKRVSAAYVWSLALGLVPLFLLGLLLAASAMVAGSTTGGEGGDYVSGAIRTTNIASLAILAVATGAITARWLSWRRTRYALDRDRLLVRTGWWRRRLVVLPIARIQSIDIAQSFVSRWFGTASMIFGVAGGGGFSGHRIPSLPRETARHLREELLA